MINPTTEMSNFGNQLVSNILHGFLAAAWASRGVIAIWTLVVGAVVALAIRLKLPSRWIEASFSMAIGFVCLDMLKHLSF